MARPPRIVLRCWLAFLSAGRQIRVSDQLHARRRQRAIDPECRANESTIAVQYNGFQQKHAGDRVTVTYGSVDDTGVTRGWQEPDPVFPRSRASPGADSALAVT